jgi:hypothetical protein
MPLPTPCGLVWIARTISKHPKVESAEDPKPSDGKSVVLMREAECLSNTIYSVTRRGRRDPSPLATAAPHLYFTTSVTE